jgi:hypothetical protein
MAAEVIKALIKEPGVNPNDIEDLLMGCASLKLNKVSILPVSYVLWRDFRTAWPG